MNKHSFKDHFSKHSQGYKKFRPLYPIKLFAYLASLTPTHKLAWDCATGTGQAATELAHYFDYVIASDASQQQIDHAKSATNIDYRVFPAEQTDLDDHSVDLISVAQALHWFDRGAFFAEAKRVLKPQGVLAIWSYNLLTINSAIDGIINNLYNNILGDFWPIERRMVENAYQNIEFPFAYQINTDFHIETDWSLTQLTGYLGTWSAVNAYISKEHTDPIDLIYDELLAAWGDKETVRKIKWPINVIIARP